MSSSFITLFKRKNAVSQLHNKIYELTLKHASSISSFISRYRTNLTNFMNYKKDIFAKEISKEFNDSITNYITQSFNVKYLKHAVNLIKFNFKNDWYQELVEQNVYPSNIGIVCESLCDDKNLYLLENSTNKLETLKKILNGTVAYTLAIAFGEDNVLIDFEKILNNKKIFDYFKTLNKKVYQEFGDFKENIKTIIKTDPNHYIGEFEIDILTNKNYLIDVKCSKFEFKPSWIKQLFVYSLCIKKYMNIQVEKIIVLNPVTNKNYSLDLSKFLDYDFWLKWCDKNFIL